MARFRVVSGMDELGFHLLSYLENRVVNLQSAVTTGDVVTWGEYFHQTEE